MVTVAAVLEPNHLPLDTHSSLQGCGAAARLRRELHCADLLALLVCRARSAHHVRDTTCCSKLLTCHPQRDHHGYLPFPVASAITRGSAPRHGLRHRTRRCTCSIH